MWDGRRCNHQHHLESSRYQTIFHIRTRTLLCEIMSETNEKRLRSTTKGWLMMMMMTVKCTAIISHSDDADLKLMTVRRWEAATTAAKNEKKVQDDADAVEERRRSRAFNKTKFDICRTIILLLLCFSGRWQLVKSEYFLLNGSSRGFA